MTKLNRSVTNLLNAVTYTDSFRFTDVLQMFRMLFWQHSVHEVEEQFGVGLPSTTPSIGAIQERVAHPWFFSRVLVFLGLAFLAILIAYTATDNLILVPAIMLTGSFAPPISVAVFFFECNLPRNISIYSVIRMFTWGGVLGIVLSLILFRLGEALPTQWLGDSVAAFIEEPAKLTAVVLLASRRTYPWTLNGLCLGAAVGAGFAAFESAGYAFSAFIQVLVTTSDLRQANAALLHTLSLRGLLSPFAHVVWTAIAAGALWRVLHDSEFRFELVADWRFSSPFAAIMMLHFVWNSPLLSSLPFSSKYILLGMTAWTIAFGLIFTGYREVREAAATERKID